MNETIKLLQSHRSYRDYDSDFRLPKEDLQSILDASRQAPSWMNGQDYSIVVLDDKALQKRLSDAMKGHNPQVETCSVFLLYLIDMRRMEVAAAMHGRPYAVQGDLDSLLTSVTDASLAMQNATVAAEALGYGTVNIGGVRRIVGEIIEMLNLPEYVYPLCGLCVGKPIVEMNIKPRLPEDCVVFRNGYDSKGFEKALNEYDITMKQFGEARETKLWTLKFADYHSDISNAETNERLKKQKFID